MCSEFGIFGRIGQFFSLVLVDGWFRSSVMNLGLSSEIILFEFDPTLFYICK